MSVFQILCKHPLEVARETDDKGAGVCITAKVRLQGLRGFWLLVQAPSSSLTIGTSGRWGGGRRHPWLGELNRFCCLLPANVGCSEEHTHRQITYTHDTHADTPKHRHVQNVHRHINTHTYMYRNI